MYRYICMYICVRPSCPPLSYIYVYIYTYMYIYIFIYKCMYKYICIYLWMCLSCPPPSSSWPCTCAYTHTRAKMSHGVPGEVRAAKWGQKATSPEDDGGGHDKHIHMNIHIYMWGQKARSPPMCSPRFLGAESNISSSIGPGSVSVYRFSLPF